MCHSSERRRATLGRVRRVNKLRVINDCGPFVGDALVRVQSCQRSVMSCACCTTKCTRLGIEKKHVRLGNTDNERMCATRFEIHKTQVLIFLCDRADFEFVNSELSGPTCRANCEEIRDTSLPFTHAQV